MFQNIVEGEIILTNCMYLVKQYTDICVFLEEPIMQSKQNIGKIFPAVAQYICFLKNLCSLGYFKNLPQRYNGDY